MQVLAGSTRASGANIPQLSGGHIPVREVIVLHCAGVLTYLLAADSPRGVWPVRTQFPVRHDPLVEFGALTPYFNRARSSIVPKPSTACR
jgi:hypothetical protein